MNCKHSKIEKGESSLFFHLNRKLKFATREPLHIVIFCLKQIYRIERIQFREDKNLSKKDNIDALL